MSIAAVTARAQTRESVNPFIVEGWDAETSRPVTLVGGRTPAEIACA